MAYSMGLTQFLTGATKLQLNDWARKGILVPGISKSRPKVYSFRDILALRAMARLQAEESLQKIRAALEALKVYDLTGHSSVYRFAMDRKTVKLWIDEGFTDVVNNPGPFELFTLEDVYNSFLTFEDYLVPNLRKPSEGIRISSERLGGIPTIRDLRIPFEAVVGWSGEVTIDVELQEHFPVLTMEDVRNAEAFQLEIERMA